MTRRTPAVVASLFALAGCAGPPTRVTVGAEPALLWGEDTAPIAAAAPPMGPDEARSIALAHDAAHTCEVTARALRAKDPARGWLVMEQCVRRPDYTDLERLLAPPWADDLQTDADQAQLLAHVVANRGGDVHYDSRLLRRARVPLFSLKAALSNPETYKGRLLLIRGQPRAGRTDAGMRALEIAETRIMAESEWVSTGRAQRTATSTDQRDGSSGTPRNGFSERTHRSEGQSVEVLHNVSVETGAVVLANLDGDTPFLESGNDYVLVLRFDGTRETVDGSELAERPLATVVAFFEPESGLFARLGR